MTTESLEELRQRLLHQKSVREMIQIRAYEIYQLRGSQPGGEAQDWFHAESEVLAFLLASESAGDEEKAGVERANAAPNAGTPAEAPPTKKPKKPIARAKRKTAEPKESISKKATTKRTAARQSPSPKGKQTNQQSDKN